MLILNGLQPIFQMYGLIGWDDCNDKLEEQLYRCPRYDVYSLLHISRMSLLHNTIHAYIGETYNERQSRVVVI